MMRKHGIAIALCASLVACGGDDKSGNAAIGKSFTYDAGTPFSANDSSAASAAQRQVAEALSVRSSTSADGAFGVADVASTTAAIFGTSASVPSGQQAASLTLVRRALSADPASSTAFDSSCIGGTGDTNVTFKDCKFTWSEDSGTLDGTINGSFSVSPDRQTLTWELAVHTTLTTNRSSVSTSFHYSGTLTVTDATIKGQMLAELSASGNVSGTPASFAVSEALLLDLTYSGTCPEGDLAGTLEAKRVWTQRPGGSESQLPDQGVKITWTDCGTGTIAHSTN
jgi:hypothetical protein